MLANKIHQIHELTLQRYTKISKNLCYDANKQCRYGHVTPLKQGDPNQ